MRYFESEKKTRTHIDHGNRDTIHTRYRGYFPTLNQPIHSKSNDIKLNHRYIQDKKEIFNDLKSNIHSYFSFIRPSSIVMKN